MIRHTLLRSEPTDVRFNAGDDDVLRTCDLRMAFGGLPIFEGLNMSVRRGERHALIGPNGSGKSTFVNLVTGFLKPIGGTVFLNGRDVTRFTPQQRVRAGLVRTCQISALFETLSPLESVVLAICQRDELANPSWRPVSRLTDQMEEAVSLLGSFGLLGVASKPSGALAHGQQRLLEVALGLSLRPRVLLLDEPAAGLSTGEGAAMFEQILSFAGETTLLFIEHDMELVFRFAQYVSVFAEGSLILQGTPEEVRADDRVRRVYLGR